jgi:hypothetical protein
VVAILEVIYEHDRLLLRGQRNQVAEQTLPAGGPFL